MFGLRTFMGEKDIQRDSQFTVSPWDVWWSLSLHGEAASFLSKQATKTVLPLFGVNGVMKPFNYMNNFARKYHSHLVSSQLEIWEFPSAVPAAVWAVY